jgi:hypothetical protein
MWSFKVKDKVKVRADCPVEDRFLNQQGEVVKVVDGNNVWVKMDDPALRSGRDDGSWLFMQEDDYLELVDPQVITTASGRQEKPCQSCRRMNDLGVSACWWCGNQP